MKSFILTLAVMFFFQAHVTLGEQVIDRFLILVHPCAYEAINTPLSNPYRARENKVRKRWAAAIHSLPTSTFVVQVDYSQNVTANQLYQSFIERLGVDHVTRIPVKVVGPSTPGPLKEYYEQINQQIRRQIAEQGLTFDPATTKTVIWGQSFEGCAAGFGSAIASYLGLKTPTTFDYNMTVPDAPFLLNATFLQTVPIPNSDIEVYIFDLNDGRLAAFFRSTLTPQWLDQRHIELQLNSAFFSVLARDGTTVWPQAAPPTGTKGMAISEVTGLNVVSRTTQPLMLSTVQTRFLITPKSHMTELQSAINGAKVGSRTVEVLDTFRRANSTSLGYAELPACMYQWFETTLTTGAMAVKLAEIVNTRLHISDSNCQAILDVNFKDVYVSTDIMFITVGENGILPKGDAGIMLRKATLDAGAWDAADAEKIAVEIGPSGFISVIEIAPTVGTVKVLAGINPWTKSTVWNYGTAGSLPATVNGLPFDTNRDGCLSNEVFRLSATLVGHNLSILINDQQVLSLTVAGIGGSHNYISLFSNQVGLTGTTHVYFDNVRIELVGQGKPDPTSSSISRKKE